MTALPKISERDIRARVGEASFEKGEDYYQDGAILSPHRQGMTIRSRCEGSSGGPYRVEVTFDAKGIASADCSCPVGGYCKHVAALLLTWKNRPESFREVEETDTALEKRSREELIALIKLMLRREPDLEVLLNSPLPGARRAGEPARPEAYRRQAELAFDRDTDEWGAAGEIADELEALVEDGKQFLAAKDVAGATAVYQGVLETVLENYESVHDEEGDLHRIVYACSEGLSKCLEAEADPARRETVLRVLFEVYRLDTERGGIGLSDGVPDFAEVCTPEERRMIAGWVREALAAGGGGRDWSRGQFGGLLLELEADEMDDEAFLRVCRETGRRQDLVDRLLDRGRIDEAVRAAEEGTSDGELLSLADLLVSRRRGEVAERLVRERAQKSSDSRLLEWLKKRAAARHDSAAVLDLSEKLFRARPSIEGYREVRKLAEKEGTWASLRPKLMTFLEAHRPKSVLIRAHLENGDVDRALEAMKGEPASHNWRYGFGHETELEVAKAAEKERPRAALEIYRRKAEGNISCRNRDSYRAAAQFLKKVRDLYKQLGDEAGWAQYVGRLRQQHRSLRALMEEMNRARL
jgi:uncharacterized Zn finger protein